jgi:aryl-alcohol dehydrogenase-like predicted oxidoreductase
MPPRRCLRRSTGVGQSSKQSGDWHCRWTSALRYDPCAPLRRCLSPVCGSSCKIARAEVWQLLTSVWYPHAEFAAPGAIVYHMTSQMIPVPRRRLGRTGEMLSMIGMGGIVVMDAEPAHAADVVAEAVDRGVNYFDVAPTYGNAEEILGPALQPHRDKSFLACKTTCRDAAGAREELERSLKRMRTDHFDLYQLHALIDPEKDLQPALGPGGALETILKARDEGKVRYIGFSAHRPDTARMAIEQFDFDSILFPINMFCHFGNGFEEQPLELARQRDMGILALKSMARSSWENGSGRVVREHYAKCWYEPLVTREEALPALRFTLGQPGLTALLPPGEELLFRLALDLVPELATAEAHPVTAVPEPLAAVTPLFA